MATLKIKHNGYTINEIEVRSIREALLKIKALYGKESLMNFVYSTVNAANRIENTINLTQVRL